MFLKGNDRVIGQDDRDLLIFGALLGVPGNILGDDKI